MPRRIKRGRKIDTLKKIYVHWVSWGYCSYKDRDDFVYYLSKYLNKKAINIIVKLTEDLNYSKAQLVKYKQLSQDYLSEIQKFESGGIIEVQR